MLKRQWRLITAFVFLVDLGLTILAFALAYHLRNRILPLTFPEHFITGLHPWVRYKELIPAVIVIWSFFLWYFELYKSHRTSTLIREMLDIGKVIFFSTLVLSGYILFLKIDFISRPWLGIFMTMDALFLLVERLFLRMAARWVRKRGFNYRNLLIVGDGPNAVKLAELIQSHPHWGYRFLGYLSDGTDPSAEPSLGKLEDLSDLLTREVVDDVIFVVNRRKLEDLRDALLTCQDVGVNTRIALHTIPVLGGTIHLEEIDHTPLLSLSRTPSNLFALLIKRLIDLVLSLTFSILSLPLAALFALFIKWETPGPVIYRQIRVGLNGRRFKLYKFRTMQADADQRLEEVRHLNEMDGPVFKSKSDPRITKVGRFLRKFSFDELPQLWNILKGDMSIVGPRPPIPEEVEQYEKWQRRRLSMKPGLTCLWQVSGRNKLDFQKWMELDLAYIDNWSLWLDAVIMLKTIPAVLLGRGAR
ncbi:MAG TPA: sugar transferase [Thermoanaerobaculia bacterium]|nr:sugar transferase [Thermoanaerobaculia bacterium]HUM28838.1 sugar transferase [Thermoanaerobaculia bacterium]HXK67228.1 sugar transferase [Thermoanaerobaculia bacterium]